MEKICKNCRFFNKESGECRRFPPSVFHQDQGELGGYVDVKFPFVREDDWCGEFKGQQITPSPNRISFQKIKRKK